MMWSTPPSKFTAIGCSIYLSQILLSHLASAPPRAVHYSVLLGTTFSLATS